MNVGQLNSVADSLAGFLGGGASFAGGVFTAPTYAIQGSDYNDVGGAFAAVDDALDDLQTQIDDIELTPGPQGPAGADGEDGADGAAGPQGPAGEDGEDGAVGPQGPQGPAGEDGSDGIDGQDGQDGEDGIDGQDGRDGVDGRDGIDGQDGEDGEDGGTLVDSDGDGDPDRLILGDGDETDGGSGAPVGGAGTDQDHGIRVSNVADGQDDDDAVNVGQMNGGDAATLVEARDYADAGDAQTLSSARDYTDSRFDAMTAEWDGFRDDVWDRLDETDRRINQTGAMNTAMGQMAASAAGIRTQNRVAVGVGFQEGEKALAIGYQRAIGERATITVGGAFSGDESTVGAGVGFGW